MKNVLKNINYDKYYKQILPYALEEKNKQYFFLILTFGASIFFLLFAISPTISTIANLKKQISDSKFVEQKLSQKINSLSSLSQSYNNISDDISFATDAVPKQPDVPTLTAQIQSIANNSGVNVTNILILPLDLTTTQATVSSSLGFDITAQGSYDSMQSFLKNLIGMQRVLSVDSMNITKAADSSDNLQVDLKGSAFYKP